MGNIEQLTAGGAASRWSALLAFIVCFVFVGMPLGALLGTWLARRQAANDLRRAGIEHVPELSECRKHLVVYLLALGRIRLRLLLLKSKLLLQKALLKIELLVQQAFLKAIGNPTHQHSADESAGCAREKNVVGHKSVMKANDPSSATRPAGRHDCNSDAMAGFAAAHG